MKELEFNYLQLNAVALLIKHFEGKTLNDLVFLTEMQIGNRGEFEGKQNLLLEIKFQLKNIKCEFFISYDQLEFYAFKQGSELYSINLEDFGPQNKMLETFSEYLNLFFAKIES